jgi:hypothetical protein
MRFIKQRDKFRCAPVAALNALRWAGVDADSELIYTLEEEMDCTYNGTKPRHFDRVLREYGSNVFSVLRHSYQSIAELEEHLLGDGAAIVNFQHDHGRHYAMITNMSKTGGTFEVVNWFSGKDVPSVVHCRRKTFLKDIFYRKGDPLYKIWFLEKKDA